MRSGNRTIPMQPNFTQTYHQFQPFIPQLSQPYVLSRSRANTQRQWQKTEQPLIKQLSPNASKHLNDQMYKIASMDQSSVENGLRKSGKIIYELVDNELLFGIKHFSSMKLLLYHVMIMYADEFSQHQSLTQSQTHRQKSGSISSSKNITTLKQHDITLNSAKMRMENSYKQLQNLKQTIPFIPKDKSSKTKNARIQMLEQELSTKIQSTKQSLENILKKIEYQANYRLSGEDIMRLKKSVVNVSELNPSHFINLNSQSPQHVPKPNTILQGSRPQSRQGRQDKQTSNITRGGSKSKTYTGGFKQTFITPNTNGQGATEDDQGNKLLIQQLEQIIQRKENRIKQLTKELTKNLSDQRELQKTIENFQIQIGEIQRDRKNFQQIIQKLQEENLNYQLQIKELMDAAALRQQTNRLSTSHQQDSSHYQMLKEFQTRQKVMRFKYIRQLELSIEPFLLTQNQSRQKDINSMSGGSPFNDISEITPKRQGNKQPFLPTDIDESYILDSNIVTTRKNISPQVTSNQKSSQNRSVSKYQMVGNARTQSKSKKNIESISNSRQEMKDIERYSFQKMLYVQALTIQQILSDM